MVRAGGLRGARARADPRGRRAAGRAAEAVQADPRRHSVAQDGQRLLVRFEAETLDAALPATNAPDLIQALRASDTAASIIIDLGPRFASFRASDLPGTPGTVRIVTIVTAEAFLS